MYEMLSNNQVTIAGEVKSGFEFSHDVYGEKFYTFDLEVPRFSDAKDLIPVMISERVIDVTQDYVGCGMSIQGQYRSYNQHDGERNRLVLSVFAREVEFIDVIVVGEECNSIVLSGYVCKEPKYRKTPLGREIADLLIAVNRPYGKSDYIPCICWGRNARYANEFKVGECVEVSGRIQSREYQKKIGEDSVEKRVAYEVSVSRITVVEDGE